MTPLLSPIEECLPSLLASLLRLRLAEKKGMLEQHQSLRSEYRTASVRPLRHTHSHVPEPRQRAAGSAASYANKGEDKSTAPAEESGDGIMITN